LLNPLAQSLLLNPFQETRTMSNHARNSTLKLVLVAAALFVSAIATSSPAHAGRGHFRQDTRNCVPEIDAGTASSAIALAVGGLALLRDRSRRR
jgi:hypothetical protein